MFQNFHTELTFESWYDRMRKPSKKSRNNRTSKYLVLYCLTTHQIAATFSAAIHTDNICSIVITSSSDNKKYSSSLPKFLKESRNLMIYLGLRQKPSCVGCFWGGKKENPEILETGDVIHYDDTFQNDHRTVELNGLACLLYIETCWISWVNISHVSYHRPFWEGSTKINFKYLSIDYMSSWKVTLGKNNMATVRDVRVDYVKFEIAE